MDALKCITTRKSIRKFTPDPVPRKDLEAMIAAASRSPSYKNTQPWEVAVVSGEKKQGLSKMMLEMLNNESPAAPDLVAPRSWPEKEQKRISTLMQRRKELTGIDLMAPENVFKAKKANFNFYFAPHAIYLYQDNSLSQWSLFDLGLFAQNLMLAAHAMGLATVPQAFVTDYASEIKAFLGIPDSKRLVLGLSLGYPIVDAPVNAYNTERSPVDEITTWLE